MKRSITQIANRTFKIGFALAMALSLSLTACKKDEDDPKDNNDGTTKLGNGTLVAVKSQTVQDSPIGPITIDVGTAVAVFDGGNNWSSFADAGNVQVNGESMEKSGNNTYLATASAANPTGIEFGNTVEWSVEGNTSSNVPAFNHTVTGGFPNVGNVNVDETISKSDGLNLPITGVSNADSLYVNVSQVVKVLPANASTANFSSAELSSVSNGTAIVSIAAVRYTTATYGGNTYYFLTETVKQKSVTITD